MNLSIDPDLKTEFPGLNVKTILITGVKVLKTHTALEKLKAEIFKKVRESWTLDKLKEYPVFRAYRDFFWRIGVDPTKTRPAAEALIRRVLHDRPLPTINTLVDAYNLASMDSAIALAVFDEDKLRGKLLLRRAKFGEKFLGIGMKKPVIVDGGEVVIADDEKLVAIYPYRDAEECKITLETEKAFVLVCGVPNIEDEALEAAGQIVKDYVTRFCGGLED